MVPFYWFRVISCSFELQQYIIISLFQGIVIPAFGVFNHSNSFPYVFLIIPFLKRMNALKSAFQKG